MAKQDFGIRLPRNRDISLIRKPSTREYVPAKVKEKVKERAKNKCEYPGCRHKEHLQFHHKNMKNWDGKISNIELLCPNHHAKRHSEKIRKVVYKEELTGYTKKRLVKKTKKKPIKKKTKSKKPKSLWGGLKSIW